MPSASFEIDVEIDENSWGGGKVIPPSLAGASGAYQIDYFGMLHLIGFLTTPTPTRGVSLAEYWAQLRYCHAINFEIERLALHHNYRALDPHQKTILSDDFGVGLSCKWLIERLNIVAICDGLYFINNLAHRFARNITANAEHRGPSKSPDFIAVDNQGKWHVIECKGTQSGPNARQKQIRKFDRNGNLVGGGVTQKATVTFPASDSGEQLVAGACIAHEETGENSSLLIVDPERKPILELNEQEMSSAYDPMYRSSVSKALALVGARSLSSIFAEPDFGRTTEPPTYQEWRALLRSEASNELARLMNTTGERAMRELSADLAVPIVIGEHAYSKAYVRYHCSKQLLEKSDERRDESNPLSRDEDFWKTAVTTPKFSSDVLSSGEAAKQEATASMKVGSEFEVELILQSQQAG